MSMKLKPTADQVIVITGASSGIGLVTARTAAKQGAKVLLVARSEDELGEIVRDINNAGGQADYAVADVADSAAVEAAAAKAVERFGRIDTWVNNAGSVVYSRLLHLPEDEHQQLFQTNYFGMVHGCRAAVPRLRDAGGALITVGSVASDMPSPVMGAYAATKHALKAYVESLRIELKEDAPRVSVTLIKPAGIDTPIGQHATNHEGGEAQIPPPAYDPQLVADAILHAAEHPTRNLTVGGVGRAQVLFRQLFPALFEALGPLAGKAAVDQSKEQPGPSNLFEAGPAGEERSGEHPSRLRHSIYTAAAKHPGTTAVIGLGGLAVAVGVLFANGRRKG
jgi:short-subunit dehydrogenase